MNIETRMKRAQSSLAIYPDHPYRILIIGGPGTGKTNTLLNLINNQ